MRLAARATSAGVAVALVAAALAGCTGSSDPAPSPSPTSLPRPSIPGVTDGVYERPGPLGMGQVGSMLPTEDDWEIVAVSRFKDPEGSYEVSSEAPGVSTRTAEGIPAMVRLTWRRDVDWDAYRGNLDPAAKVGTVRVLGEASVLYADAGDTYTAVRPVEDGSFVEIRGIDITRDAFKAFLSTLVPATKDQFKQRAEASGLVLDETGSAAR